MIRNNLISLLEAKFKDSSIIITGSFILGNFKEKSDIDVIVLSQQIAISYNEKIYFDEVEKYIDCLVYFKRFKSMSDFFSTSTSLSSSRNFIAMLTVAYISKTVSLGPSLFFSCAIMISLIFMKNIIAVFLLSELKGGSDGVNLAFEYTDGSALPKLGEFVYFGSPEVKFQISAREHLFQDDETVRIIYRLTRPQRQCVRGQ